MMSLKGTEEYEDQSGKVLKKIVVENGSWQTEEHKVLFEKVLGNNSQKIVFENWSWQSEEHKEHKVLFEKVIGNDSQKSSFWEWLLTNWRT